MPVGTACAGASMLIRSRSTTIGSRRTWAWIAVTYSPRMPINASCIPERKNSDTISVIVPRGAAFGNCVHKILETVPFAELASPVVHATLARIARDEGWRLVVHAEAGGVTRHVLEISGLGGLVDLR